MSHHDVVVVGTGLAGLTAAVRLAESGARVLVVAKGIGATHLSPGTIDVLGYAPARVEHPGEALGALVEAQPAHPYRLVGADGVGAAIGWFKERVANGSLAPYAYTGGLRGEPAAADRGRRPAPLGGRAGDDGRRRSPRRRPGLRRRVPRAQGLPPGAAGRQPRRAPGWA